MTILGLGYMGGDFAMGFDSSGNFSFGASSPAAAPAPPPPPQDSGVRQAVALARIPAGTAALLSPWRPVGPMSARLQQAFAKPSDFARQGGVDLSPPMDPPTPTPGTLPTILGDGGPASRPPRRDFVQAPPKRTTIPIVPIGIGVGALALFFVARRLF